MRPLAELSDGDITETAVEIISIFVLDSKWICLETKLKKEYFCFALLRSKVVFYYIHLEYIGIFSHCSAYWRKTGILGKIGTHYLSLESSNISKTYRVRKGCIWIYQSNNWLLSVPFSALFLWLHSLRIDLNFF